MKTQVLEKNTKWESASSSADFEVCPGFLGLEASLLCPEYGWMRKAVSNHTLRDRNRTRSLQSSKDFWVCITEAPFSLALGDVMPMSPGPRKFTMTNGEPQLWIHIPSQKSSNSPCQDNTEGAARECQSAMHRAFRSSEIDGSHSPQKTFSDCLDTRGLLLLHGNNSYTFLLFVCF